jgi:hypothetical protein
MQVEAETSSVGNIVIMTNSKERVENALVTGFGVSATAVNIENTVKQKA